MNITPKCNARHLTQLFYANNCSNFRDIFNYFENLEKIPEIPHKARTRAKQGVDIGFARIFFILTGGFFEIRLVCFSLFSDFETVEIVGVSRPFSSMENSENSFFDQKSRFKRKSSEFLIKSGIIKGFRPLFSSFFPDSPIKLDLSHLSCRCDRANHTCTHSSW